MIELTDRIETARSHVQSRVDEKTWQAFCMIVDQDKSRTEVAQSLGMTTNAVWTALVRIRRLLREELGDLNKPTGDEK